MEAVVVVTGRAVPLDRTDVDTDQIIPSEWLKRVERSGFGRGLFSEWRDDPQFVLNQPDYQGATILLAGPRFGTGSSREHAVWALMDYGFLAVIAVSFGDIFANNASKQGLVTVALPSDDVDDLASMVTYDPQLHITIDVTDLTVEVPSAGWRRSFVLGPLTRKRLLNGWDDIGLTMRHADEIATYEASHHSPSLEGVFDAAGRVRS
jgi:3-isopropylmalate/(R)-2-methylmalate dehydratase small subunit